MKARNSGLCIAKSGNPLWQYKSPRISLLCQMYTTVSKIHRNNISARAHPTYFDSFSCCPITWPSLLCHVSIDRTEQQCEEERKSEGQIGEGKEEEEERRRRSESGSLFFLFLFFFRFCFSFSEFWREVKIIHHAIFHHRRAECAPHGQRSHVFLWQWEWGCQFHPERSSTNRSLRSIHPLSLLPPTCNHQDPNTHFGLRWEPQRHCMRPCFFGSAAAESSSSTTTIFWPCSRSGESAAEEECRQWPDVGTITIAVRRQHWFLHHVARSRYQHDVAHAPAFTDWRRTDKERR